MTRKSRRWGLRGQTFKGLESDPENEGEPLKSPLSLGKGMGRLGRQAGRLVTVGRARKLCDCPGKR